MQNPTDRQTEEDPARSLERGPLQLAPRPTAHAGPIFADRVFLTALRATLAVVVVVGAIFLLYLTWNIVRPFIVAVVLATMLWPWVTRLAWWVGPRDFHLPRGVAVGLIYLVFLAIAATMVYLILSTLIPWLDRLMTLYPQQTAFLHDYLAPFRSGDLASGAVKVAGEVAKQSTGETPANPAAKASTPAAVNVGALALGLFGGLLQTALILVFTFFLLLEGDTFARWVLRLVPRERRPKAEAIGLRVRERVSRWVVATAIYSAISGVVVGVAMFLIGIPSPWFFGAGAALMALIPGVGPASITILALVIALGESPWQPVAVAVFGIFLYIADATFIAPKIFGNMLRLPMFVVFLAILLGGELLGVWGAVLALPVAVTAQIVIREALGRPPADAVDNRGSEQSIS